MRIFYAYLGAAVLAEIVLLTPRAAYFTWMAYTALFAYWLTFWTCPLSDLSIRLHRFGDPGYTGGSSGVRSTFGRLPRWLSIALGLLLTAGTFWLGWKGLTSTRPLWGWPVILAHR